MTINCESLLVKLANILYFNLEEVRSMARVYVLCWLCTCVSDEPRINGASAAVQKHANESRL